MTGTPVLPTDNAPLLLDTASMPTTNGAIDSVYIIATSDELTLIKPMIDMAISTKNAHRFMSVHAVIKGNGARFSYGNGRYPI